MEDDDSSYLKISDYGSSFSSIVKNKWSKNLKLLLLGLVAIVIVIIALIIIIIIVTQYKKK